jgi:hypothetical protein
MLSSWRNTLDEIKVRKEILEGAKKRFQRQLKEFEDEMECLQEAKSIFQKAATMTQNHLAEHLSGIVTKSLRTIWTDSNIEFKTKFVERRNTTECDMWIEEDGHEFSLLDSRGYGVVDVVSFSLKVAYILLHNCDNVIVIDEPFRNCSRDRHERISMLVKELSEELDMQFIISTHMTQLKEYADKSFEVENGSLIF